MNKRKQTSIETLSIFISLDFYKMKKIILLEEECSFAGLAYGKKWP